MKISEDDVRHVEELANLELTAAERTRMVRDLNSILDYVDRLNELDTSNVPPMAQVSSPATQNDPTHVHVLRADELKPSLPHAEAMQNAPDTDETFFRVPKVVER
jgi:aspartyl-tRNA(Asn)/glutamyl-tRNA(Gln) amidotransferase subunit C